MSDKKYLSKTYGKKIGKASVTGYCVKFKTLKEINIEMLEAVIRDGFETQTNKVNAASGLQKIVTTVSPRLA